MKDFFKNVKAEFNKISLPKKNILIKDVRDTFLTATILTIILFAINSSFSYIVNLILSLI